MFNWTEEMENRFARELIALRNRQGDYKLHRFSYSPDSTRQVVVKLKLEISHDLWDQVFIKGRTELGEVKFENGKPKRSRTTRASSSSATINTQIHSSQTTRASSSFSSIPSRPPPTSGPLGANYRSVTNSGTATTLQSEDVGLDVPADNNNGNQVEKIQVTPTASTSEPTGTTK